MIETHCRIRVRYAETDQMGVVYHGNYFVWFETARVEMLDTLGWPYIELEKAGYRLPVIECSATFQRPAHFDDRLCIHCLISERPGLRIKVAYKVYREEELLAEGFTHHVFIDAQGRPAKPPSAFLAVARQHFKSS